MTRRARPRARRAGPGRPALPDGERRASLTVTLSPAVRALLEEYAAYEGVSLSRAVEDLIRSELSP